MAGQKLKDSELRYRRLFESAQDGILILDAVTGAIVDVNPFLIEMLGYLSEEFIGKKLWEMGAFKDIQASKDAFLALQKNENILYKDLPLRAKDGKLYQVEFVSNVYMVGKDKIIQCNIRDMTERKHALDALAKSEANMREQVTRDHLTGLFNRRYLEETLDRELRRALRKKFSLGIIMLDVDDFKHFNDTYGHAAGDEILRELGKLLKDHVRGEDIASRYGGDEFMVVLTDASLEVTKKRAELLCEYAHLFHIQFDGRNLEQITLSVGVAVYPDHGSNRETILRAADSALYRAKQEGRDQVIVSK